MIIPGSVLYLENGSGETIALDIHDPTLEQIVTADLSVTSVPTSTARFVNPNDYSGEGGGGAIGFNLRLFEDTFTVTCLLRDWNTYWRLYEWTKFDYRVKALHWGRKTYCVHIKRISASTKAGQDQLTAVNIGFVVINPPG